MFQSAGLWPSPSRHFPPWLCDFLPSSSITHLQPQLINLLSAVGLLCPGCTASCHRLCLLSALLLLVYTVTFFFSHDISCLGLYILTHNTNRISRLSGSFCSFCHELGQGTVPLMVLSVDIIILELSVVITVSDQKCACLWMLQVYEPRWASAKLPYSL